jgi:FkbM family methyltransferase
MLLEKITKIYPFYRGRGRIALSNFERQKNNQIMLKQLRTGEYIYIFPNDYIGRMVTFFGDLDPSVTDFILKNVAKGDVVIDVGANLGVITLPAATKVAPPGKVISIEPNENVSKALEMSVRKNNFSNVEIIQKGLSDYSGEARLSVPSNSYGQAKLSSDGCQTCEVMQLDDLSIYPHRFVRILKIDVEGHESRVLKGGRKFIKNSMVDIIIFESHKIKDEFSQREEVALLKELGYKIFELRRNIFLTAKLGETASNFAKYIQKSDDFVAVRHGVTFRT